MDPTKKKFTMIERNSENIEPKEIIGVFLLETNT